jgi:hypothetical protein
MLRSPARASGESPTVAADTAAILPQVDQETLQRLEKLAPLAPSLV